MIIVNTIDEAVDAFKEIHTKLSEYFNPNEIKFRVGSTFSDKNTGEEKGLALAYVDARTVMDRLDDVLGTDGWEDSYRRAETGGNQATFCTLTIRVWVKELNSYLEVSKEDVGITERNEEDKGSASDALKRAAVKFGVSRYLYSFPAQFVPIRNKRFTREPNIPSWAMPNSVNPDVLKDAIRKFAEENKHTYNDVEKAHAILKDVMNYIYQDENDFARLTQNLWSVQPEELSESQVNSLLSFWLKPSSKGGKISVSKEKVIEARNLI